MPVLEAPSIGPTDRGRGADVSTQVGNGIGSAERARGSKETDSYSPAPAEEHVERPTGSEQIDLLQSLFKPAAIDANGQALLPTHKSVRGGARAGAPMAMSNGETAPALVGRQSEGKALHRLLDSVREAQSRVLVVRGEAGVGKSALLEYLVETAAGCRVARAAGVESEMELAYAGLHQLCAGLLDLEERLPPPQREALATVFGLDAGPAPDPFLVGLATLTLFAALAERRPLVCVVDDAQWLDQASAQVLGFVARRVFDERIAIVCAVRTGSGDDVLGEFPQLHIRGLVDSDARALLLDEVHGPLDAAICEQIVTESHGNPLALLELPRRWNAADLAGGFGLPGSGPVAGKIERSYAQRLLKLPTDAQLLVLAAAAEPLGDPALLDRVAGVLGLRMASANPAVDAGLLRVGARVTFAHPLARSVAYRIATADDRQRVHRALAEAATDGEADPDRRAWHRGHASAGPDEQVAAELDRSAGRAQARGGIAAAAAFLQRAAELTVEPTRRTERALAAAQASLQAGAFRTALGSVAEAESGPLDEFQFARAALVRARVAFASDLGSDAPPLLLEAARRLEPFDLESARATYLVAWGAAGIAGHLVDGALRPELCRAVQALPSSDGNPRPVDLLLEGLALLATDGHNAAAASLQRAAKELIDIPVDDALQWGWIATDASGLMWDIEGMREISARQVRLIRLAGALAELPLHLWQLGVATAWVGDFMGAASLVAESDSVAAATGSQIAPYLALRLAALRGNEAECSALIATALEHANALGQGTAVVHAHWAAAVLHNGLARYEQAASAAQHATTTTPGPSLTTPCGMWTLPELVEAAARSGDPELARRAFKRLEETTAPCGNDIALGIEARCGALLLEGAAAEKLYRDALERLSRTQLRPELARAHLVYGEWLRREGRRVDARAQLHSAYDMLAAIGMTAFAERARRELLATGDKAPRRAHETRDLFTPQERQIARLARDGMSNPEIGAQLFISARTIEWHLRHVYAKLGIRSRKQLRTVLPSD